MHTNNGDTARAAALGGAGIIWQPTFLIGADLREGRLQRVLPGFSLPDIDVLAVYPSRRHLSAKVQGDDRLPQRRIRRHAAVGPAGARGGVTPRIVCHPA